MPLVVSREISSGVEQDPDQLVADLYTVHASGLHRYLLLTGSRPADADELLQDAFLRLFRCVRDGEQIEKPKAWLIRTLQNLRTDWARRESGHGLLMRNVGARGDLAWSSPDRGPEAAMIDHQRFERLRAAMGSLTERQHQYVLMRSEGMTLREIASVHGVTVQSVAETCARAIERLGKLTNE
ncbi:sigma-70 family RNA polymerase sigma factor [uncultured Paludibaculum sp.]|uniref:RNA polymerase sigma factor n=1 Tax=uncultured Paludibaculum sp. TaxID=1765020 RepID=UPI002AAAB41B|nr:sigma-70 family RNA polymerase sigma factor [uncultured Paludibaculum sp.]